MRIHIQKWKTKELKKENVRKKDIGENAKQRTHGQIKT